MSSEFLKVEWMKYISSNKLHLFLKSLSVITVSESAKDIIWKEKNKESEEHNASLLRKLTVNKENEKNFIYEKNINKISNSATEALVTYCNILSAKEMNMKIDKSAESEDEQLIQELSS